MKKTLIMVVAIVLVAALAIGGTFAYLQDSDSDVNVAVVGNVDIEQIEQEWGTDGKLQPFTQAKPLYPYSGTLGWANYDDGNAETTNDAAYRKFAFTGALDKYVSVKNTGASDAYVRTWIALEQGSMPADEFNQIGVSINAENGSEFKFPGTWKWESLGTVAIDGRNYDLMVATHIDPVKPGETTIPSLLQVYMSKDATNEDVEKIDGNGNGLYEILAFSQAVQTVNFSSANEAFDAAFGPIKVNDVVTNHPWVNGVEIPTAVETADELTDALAAGEDVVLTDDIALENTKLTIANDAVIDLGGNTLSGQATNASASRLIEVKAGAELTIKNGTVKAKATQPDTDWGTEGFPGYATNTISCSGKLVIENAEIINETARGGASYAIDCYPGADVIINSGKVMQTGGDQAIRLFANSATVPTNVTVNGGEISGRRAIWIQLPSSNAAVAPKVNVTINGGVLSSTDTTGDNLAVYSYSYGNNADNVNVIINGGVFNGNLAFGAGTKNGKENVTINGGIFNNGVFRYVEGGIEDIQINAVG